MRHLLFALILLILSGPAFAAAQLPDKIIIDGAEQKLLSNPLEPLLANDRALAERFQRLLPKGICTAVWRGYVATWEVRDGQLFLTKVDINACSDATTLPLEQVFPNPGNGVPATWFSGQLTVALGRQVVNFHPSATPRYERLMVLTVDHGTIVSRELTESP